MSAEPRADGPTYDPDAVHAKYLAERDRRLVPGRAAIRDLSTDDHFARYTADPFTPVAEREPVTDDVDVVVVGAGMAGLLAAVQLQRAGLTRIRLVDIAGGVGGTWYWNRYPGVMCDVESYVYLPMLEEMGYVPKDRYSSGEEIRLHLQSIAERHEIEGSGHPTPRHENPLWRKLSTIGECSRWAWARQASCGIRVNTAETNA